MLEQGDTARITAVLRDAAGNALVDRPIAWSSSDAAVAQVDGGLVTGKKGGSASIYAESDGMAARATARVTMKVMSTVLWPSAVVLSPGDTITLNAEVRDGSGWRIEGVELVWTSSDPAVASVTPSGLVRAMTDGAATISAAVQQASGLTSVTVESPPSQLTFLDVSAGGVHSCGIAQGGRAYCWGDNSRGQLGNGRLTATTGPTLVAGSLSFVAIATGWLYTCGLTTDGAAYCWGDNTWGQLGYGDAFGQGCSAVNNASCTVSPTLVTGRHHFRSIVTGYDHACGITVASQVMCWGWGENGELGADLAEYCNVLGDARCSAKPVLADAGRLYAQIVAGFEHTCGVREAGDAYCWGHEHDGQLGTGSAALGGGTARAVAGGFRFASLAIGGNSSCGVAEGGRAYCWGQNNTGQLGDSSITTRLAPVAVSGGLTFSLLTVGSSARGEASATCGLVLDGSAYCWGANEDGALGDGTTQSRLAPTAVKGGLEFRSISAGGAHSCGVATDGVAYCWGVNTLGQLGDATLVNRLTPGRVAGQIIR